MSSNVLQKKIFDTVITPPPPAASRMIGSEEYKVRVQSALLPDCPSTLSSPANTPVYIPRLNGGRKLYVEQSEPAWLTGAHGGPKPAKTDMQEPHWHNQHTALRAQNLTRNASTPTSGSSLEVNISPEDFGEDAMESEGPAPVVDSQDDPFGDSHETELPGVSRGNDLDVIRPTALLDPVGVHDAGIADDESLNHDDEDVCESEEPCPPEETPECTPAPFVFPIRPPGYVRPVFKPMCRPEAIPMSREEAVAAASAALNGPAKHPPQNRQPVCTCPDPQTQEEPVLSAAALQERAEAASKAGGPAKIFGKGIAFLTDWKKRPTMIKLEDRSEPVTTKSKHYEGCILCTPRPSPNSSMSDSQIGGKELYAPSRQDPGPPPLTPPPTPGSEEIDSDFEDLQRCSSRKSAMIPSGFSQMNTMLAYPGYLGEPGSRIQSMDEFNIDMRQSSQEGDGPYNTSGSYHDADYCSNNLNWPLTANEGHVGTSGLQGRFHGSDPEFQSSISPSGSIELLTGNKTTGYARGRRNYPGWSNNEASSSRNPNNGETATMERSSIFHKGAPGPEIENGVKRLPLSNSPIFPGNSGIMRLPDEEIPHPGERKDHQAIGADGVYEMVDLGAPNPDGSEPAAVEEGEGEGEGGEVEEEEEEDKVIALPSVWQLLKEKAKKAVVVCSSITLIKIEMRRFWYWVVFEGGYKAALIWAALLLLIVIVTIVSWIVPTAVRHSADNINIELTNFGMEAINPNLTDITLGVQVTLNSKKSVDLEPAAFNLLGSTADNFRFIAGIPDDAIAFGTEKTPTEEELHPQLGVVLLPNGGRVVNGDANLTLSGHSKLSGSGFQITSGHQMDLLGELFSGVVWGDYDEKHGMTVILDGSVDVKSSMPLPTNIRHNLIIHATGGFQDLRVDSYQMLRPEDGFMNATLSWFNPSNVTMKLGDAGFKIVFDGRTVGNATIPGLEIHPGDNTANLSSILFKNSAFSKNKILLKEFISSLASQGFGQRGQKLMVLEGTGITVNGLNIPYMRLAIQSFFRDLPIPKDPGALASINPEIYLVMVEDNRLDLRLADAMAKIKLPFASGGFPASVDRVAYNLKLTLPSGKSLTLFRVQDSVTLTTDFIQKSDVDEVTNFFMPELAKSKTVTVEVTGEASMQVVTPLGNGTVIRVPLRTFVWEIQGLDSLGGKVRRRRGGMRPRRM